MKFIGWLILLTSVSVTAQGLGASKSTGTAAVVLCRYDNLNLSATGWGSCGDSPCAGGMGNSSGMTITPGSPMTLVFTSPAQYNNALFWVKPGTCDAGTWIRFEFDVTTPAGLNQKEFDRFIITPTLDGMFGGQCNQVVGHWQGANQSSGWVDDTMLCTPGVTITDGVSHHLIFSDSWDPTDTSCGGFPTLHFGSKTIDGVTQNWSTTVCATAIPSGWTHTMGCQFQMNSNIAATLTEYVNNVSCWVGK